MLENLFPRNHRKYSSLPILGPHLEGFIYFLDKHGYARKTQRFHLYVAKNLDFKLRRHLVSIDDLTVALLRESARYVSHRINLEKTLSGARVLETFLIREGILAPEAASPPLPPILSEFQEFLLRSRGFHPATARAHLVSALKLVSHLGTPAKILNHAITREKLETFVMTEARHLSRETLQHRIAHLRSLLRFLRSRGLLLPEIELPIDTPRVYRGERMPRALPWKTVRSFLAAVDRSSAVGCRDYAMFQLIVNYGLRSSEVVDLTLDDLLWRRDLVRVSRRKASTPLLFPLTSSVTQSLIAYLKKGRPSSASREVFLRARPPAGRLKPTALSNAFQTWVKRSGLEIPYCGCHCLRHAYATELLRKGTTLKIIGDLLGHRGVESTATYLRLATEELRAVALNWPPAAKN